MPRHLAAAGLVVFAILAGAPPALAASFDCARAATATEHAICEEPQIAALDEQMARDYRALLGRARGTDRAAIRAEQKSWLRTRNACAADTRCLAGEYRARIQRIAAWSAGAPPAEAPRTAVVERQPAPSGILNRVWSRPPGGQPAPVTMLRRDETPPAPAVPSQSTATAEEKPGLFRRLVSGVTPGFLKKERAETNEPPTPETKEPAAPKALSLRAEPRPRTARAPEPASGKKPPQTAKPSTAPRNVGQSASQPAEPAAAPVADEPPPNRIERKKPAAPRIVQPAPRVVVVRPRIVRDGPPPEPAPLPPNPAPEIVAEPAPPPVAATPATAAAAPETAEPLAIEAPAAARSYAEPHGDSLRSRFEAVYGEAHATPAPLQQTRRGFDSRRFDIFDEPPGG